MPSPRDGRWFSSSPLLQLAQQPADQFYAEHEDLDLGSDHPSDASSDRKDSSQRSSRKDSNGGDDLSAKRTTAGDGSQHSLDEESQDSTSSRSRSNKFIGPPSTWRNRTAAERDLAASLDQLQAKDLSVHLYNSFKLGQKNRTRPPGRRDFSREPEEADVDTKWIPPKVWTAWPLPPDTVPREHEESRWDEDAAFRVPYHCNPPRPGQPLQEMLVAQVLRKAKERFHDRQWESAPQSAKTTKYRRRQSQGQRSNANGIFSAREDHEIPHQKPVIMADDQRASEILQATVQHMMTKLDDLLVGLHHARSAYLFVEDSGNESQSQASERSTSRGRRQKKKAKASIPDADVDGSHSASNHPGRKKSSSKGKTQHSRSSSRRSRSQNFRGRKGRLGLRDWSDVLGIASMTGWHPQVVRSATARCATLLEEGIKYRTLEEGKKDQDEHVYLPNASPPVSGENSQRNIWLAREGSSNSSEGEMVGGVHVDGFLKPIEGKKSWIYSNERQSKRRQTSRKSRR